MTGNTEFFNISDTSKVKLLSPRFVYAKLLVIFALLYTAAFAVGCLLFHLLDYKSSESINLRIESYFSVDFSDCENIFDYSNTLLDMSRSDLSHLLIIFAAGFTMLAVAAISLLLVFRGFSLGFSICYFTYAVRTNAISLEYPYASVILYSAVCAVIAAIMIHISVKTALFSDEFKLLCGRPRRIIKSKAIYLQLFRFLIAFGAVIISNLIRCVL